MAETGEQQTERARSTDRNHRATTRASAPHVEPSPGGRELRDTSKLARQGGKLEQAREARRTRTHTSKQAPNQRKNTRASERAAGGREEGRGGKRGGERESEEEQASNSTPPRQNRLTRKLPLPNRASDQRSNAPHGPELLSDNTNKRAPRRTYVRARRESRSKARGKESDTTWRR